MTEGGPLPHGSTLVPSRWQPTGAHPQHIADLANTLLTTAVETWGWSWTSKGASASYGLVRRPVVDAPGLAKPPEKRKVGGSTPPLTTTPDQRGCLVRRVQIGRLTATVTATASAQRLPKLPQSLSLLIQRDMRVDRHCDLNSRVADDLLDNVRRRSKIEQERDAGMAEIMKACRAKPGALPDRAPATAKVVRLDRRTAP